MAAMDPVDYYLIETLLFLPTKGFRLFNEHLERLEKSSQALGFKCPLTDISKSLQDRAGDYRSMKKVRLTLKQNGKFEITAQALIASDPGSSEQANQNQKLSFCISQIQVDSTNPLARHKTSKRELYDSEYQKYCTDTNNFDIIFFNEKNELAEGSRTNIFLIKDGLWQTPPLTCGILEGVQRRAILNDSTKTTIERRLYLDDLNTADHIYLCNAVRGLVEVTITKAYEIQK